MARSQRFRNDFQIERRQIEARPRENLARPMVKGLRKCNIAILNQDGRFPEHSQRNVDQAMARFGFLEKPPGLPRDPRTTRRPETTGVGLKLVNISCCGNLSSSRRRRFPRFPLLGRVPLTRTLPGCFGDQDQTGDVFKVSPVVG